MRTETTDVCVIGSGAGGGLIAYEAAQRGLRTLVVERGPYVRGAQMNHDELSMIPRLYKDGGLQLNTTLDMFILQGSCVGGSTVLANYAMFRARPEVFHEWRRLGADLDLDALDRSYAKVEKLLGTRRDPPENVSPTSALLMKGATAMGLDVRWMEKALGDCTGCGGCNIGCVWDHKRSSLTTYIPWAEQRGARILADTTVEKIVWRKGQVQSLEATSGPAREPLRIVAKKVVVAGGAIGSPGLLLKSGIEKNVGRRTSFNIGAAVVAEFDDPIDAYDGDQMSVVVHGDGYNIEPVHNPPGATSLMTPGWFGDHARLMSRYRHIAFVGTMTGSQPTGRVVHSPFFGHEETRYRVSKEELGTLRRGMKDSARAMFAAGARRVMLPSHRFQTVEDAAEIDAVMDAALATRKQFDRGTSHPQGGCAWSDDPELGAVDRNFAVHGFDNLFVCDASVFPAGIGVNPIDTILAVADLAAPRILA